MVGRCSSLIVIGLAVFAAGCGSGGGSDEQIRQTSSPKIVNGIPASPEDLPLIVRIYIPSAAGSTEACTGTFISDQHVLTAAHCFENMAPGIANIWNVEVHSGDGQIRNAVGIAVHPAYIPGSFALSAQFEDFLYIPHDIAIVQTMGDPYDGPIAPISAQELFPGQQLYIAGYGRTGTNIPSDGQLRIAQTTLEAVSPLDGALYWIVEPGEGNTCFGDSGGPAFVVSPQGNLALAGITSGGAPDCDPGSLSYDTLVLSYLDFIQAVTAGNYQLE